MDAILGNEFNLDFKNPDRVGDLEHLTLLQRVDDLSGKERQILDILAAVRAPRLKSRA